MIPTPLQEATVAHALYRFVSAEAIALLLNIKPEKILKIRCWAHVILVVGKGFSRFVSYADLPPIVGVKPPTPQDYLRWRKRWQKNNYQAPAFWGEFYTQKLRQTRRFSQLHAWLRLIEAIKSLLPASAVRELQSIYTQQNGYLLPA
ncbi:hypothetical protein [Microcoleus sp. FACHB-672]|uniref:hypothetical protein n=1 Tax=Microcoleus sp. FACHB-672 TaxID=2692825 RepID=UPI0016890069|nr:hypothetical protein [Microcoleus sp. FACHB-672]MBD2040667.1 hypothetical protein [Microcoleus sp. FACHB-672]